MSLIGRVPYRSEVKNKPRRMQNGVSMLQFIVIKMRGIEPAIRAVNDLIGPTFYLLRRGAYGRFHPKDEF